MSTCLCLNAYSFLGNIYRKIYQLCETGTVKVEDEFSDNRMRMAIKIITTDKATTHICLQEKCSNLLKTSVVAMYYSLKYKFDEKSLAFSTE